MKTLKCILIVTCCLSFSAAFCQGKSAEALKGINVYFPGSEVSSHKLNLNVQGRTVAVPLCHADIAKVDDHNFSFTSTDKSDKIMRGDAPANVVTLQLVHSTSDKLVGLLKDLQAAECGK